MMLTRVLSALYLPTRSPQHSILSRGLRSVVVIVIVVLVVVVVIVAYPCSFGVVFTDLFFSSFYSLISANDFGPNVSCQFM